jgi:hypothetical protein
MSCPSTCDADSEDECVCTCSLDWDSMTSDEVTVT